MVYSIIFIKNINFIFLICYFKKLARFYLLDALFDISYNLVSHSLSSLPFSGLQSPGLLNKSSPEASPMIRYYNGFPTGEQEQLLSTEQSTSETTLRINGKTGGINQESLPDRVSGLRARNLVKKRK